MALVDCRLLGLGTAGVTGGQHAVVVVQLDQSEAKLFARAGEDLLQRRDAGFALAVLDAGDLGLGDAGPLGKLSLRKPAFEASQLQERTPVFGGVSAMPS
jgi:hypothetical protein